MRNGFSRKATGYANERKVFGRPIGQNQGVPVSHRARLHGDGGRRADGRTRGGAVRRGQALRPRIQHGEAASRRKPRGRRATCACRPTAASASPRSTDVERKFRETRLYQIAPISTNLVLCYLAEHVLHLPRSY